MKKRSVMVRSTLAAFLSAALAVTSLPAMAPGSNTNGKAIVAEAAGTASGKNPADCMNVSNTVSKAPEVIYEVPDGSASEYGLQKTKFVDGSGKKVDPEEWLNQPYIDEGDAINYIENATFVSDSIVEAGVNTTVSGGTIPASYTSPYMTRPAQDQGSWGVCWAFGATAAIEANVIKKIAEDASTFSGLTKDDVDFSERFLAWFGHNTFTTDKTDIAYGDGQKKTTPKKAFTGGNDGMVVSELAMGTGPELEYTAPYDTTASMKGVKEAVRQQSVAKLYDCNILDKYDTNKTTLDTVKAMIMNYGATTVSYASIDGYYNVDPNGETNYYYPKADSNHGIAIIGWDDSYAAGNFKNTPPGNGAWYCRNSWGDTWGNGSKKNGCFWLSYYDKSINSIAAYDMKDADAYGKAYYYVRDHWCTGINFGDPELGNNATTAANVFQASGNESLESVAVKTHGNGYKAEVTVYVSDSAMEKPTDGTKAATQTVNDLGMEGFHTIDLSKSVSLKAGQYFSVIVRLISSGQVYFKAELKSAGKEKKGQTYYYNGYQDEWVDSTASTMKDVCNAAIYAYTNPEQKETATLMEAVKQGDSLNEADVKSAGGQDAWNRIQVELKLAKSVTQSGNIKRSIAMLQSAMSSASSQNLYKDSSLTDGPGIKGVELYANGGTVKVNGVSTNYKTRTLYADFERAWSWVKKKKTFISGIKGKYVAAVTTDKDAKPILLQGGKISNPDTEAAKIATVKMSGNKVTITPKSAGDVYVWVLWCLDSALDWEGRQGAQVAFARTKVHVDAAPANVRLYSSEDADPLAGDINYASVAIPAGSGTDVYVRGTTGSLAKKTMQLVESNYVNYYSSVPAKYAPYISVTKDEQNPYKFHVDVAADILDKLKIKDGKKLSANISFICDRNGKKATLALVIGNLVKTMSVAAADSTTQFSLDSAGVGQVTFGSAKAAAQTGTIQETTSLYMTGRKQTDGTKIVRIPCADGFVCSAKGQVTVVGKVSAAQKKVSIAAVKKQPGVYKVTAAKGTPEGTEAYFVIWHNMFGKANGTGYQVVKVKVGEANHVTQMSVEKADDTTTITTGDDNIATVTLQSSQTAAAVADIQETLTLGDDSKDKTESVKIIRMPGADGFTVTTAKEISVVGSLTAQQKKVTMSAVKGKAGVYRISAAKKIQPGTEVCFMLFYNAVSDGSGTGYQIIKVKVE